MIKPSTMLFFALCMVFSTRSMAQTLKILKSYPAEGKVLVDQGSTAGLKAESDVDLLSEAGVEVKSSVVKSTASKAILKVPPKSMKLFKQGGVFTFALADAGMGNKKSKKKKRGGSKSSADYSVEIEVNPLSIVFGSVEAGGQYRLTDHFTLGVVGLYYTVPAVKGFGVGLEARYYLEKAFNQWFIGAGALTERATLSDTSKTTETGKVSVIDSFAVAGYQVNIAKHFQAVLGAGLRYYIGPSTVKSDSGLFEFSNPLTSIGFLLRGSVAVAF